MFRRGPIRRAARLLSPRPLAALEDRPRQMLLQANLHMERGEYHRAAELYENLARGAEARGLLQRAPHLYLQSSRALILAGDLAPTDCVLIDDSIANLEAARQVGFTTVLPPNAPTCLTDNWGDSWGVFSASSYHPGGVNVLMGDGSVRISPVGTLESAVPGALAFPANPKFAIQSSSNTRDR